MVDISMAGATIDIFAQDGSKLVNIGEFSDEGTPIDIPDFDIADGNMNLNGVLVTWTKAQAVEFNITLIPNSESDRLLSNFLRMHAIGGKGAIPEAFIKQLVLHTPKSMATSSTYNKGDHTYTFTNGRMRRGSPAIGSNAEGKMSARTFNFIFEKVEASL